MSQHSMVISNAPGATFRADINAAFQALISMHSGDTEPETIYPFLLWMDTSEGTGNGVLKMRNEANSAWVRLPWDIYTGTLQQDGVSIEASATEINRLKDVVAGTAAANSVLVVDASNNINLGSGTLTAGSVVVTGNVDGRDVSEDGSKLDGIEEQADVTDAENVESAGALMTSALVDEDDMESDSDTHVPTQQSVKAYVDAQEVTGATMNEDEDVSTNSWVLDEDDMASDSDNKLATQQSIKAYVRNAVEDEAIVWSLVFGGM